MTAPFCLVYASQFPVALVEGFPVLAKLIHALLIMSATFASFSASEFCKRGTLVYSFRFEPIKSGIPFPFSANPFSVTGSLGIKSPSTTGSHISALQCPNAHNAHRVG